MRGRSKPGWMAALLCGASALAGCHDGHGGSGTPDGVLTVDVRPTTMAPAGLVVSGGGVRIEGLTVLGDASPTGRSMINEFTLDLSSTGASFTLSELPQGVYSRVRLFVEHVTLDGSWRGAPLHYAWESEYAPAVDLRSNGVEVTPGHDGELAVGVDAGAWFANNILDSVPVDDNGELIIDTSHNITAGATIASRIADSFSLQDSTATQ